MLSVEEMIRDLWECTYIDPENGQRYWRMRQETTPPTPPEPESSSDEE